MPQDRKTNINNLTIVWQGQSWSIIAPNGIVLGRFIEKWDAVQFAKGYTKFVALDSEPENYADKDFIEFKDYIYNQGKENTAKEPVLPAEPKLKNDDLPLQAEINSQSVTQSQFLQRAKYLILIAVVIIGGGITFETVYSMGVATLRFEKG
jgi:hypothetical protein